MRYRKLGRTEIDVSAISLGCWAIAGDQFWGSQDERDAIDAIRTAVDCGMTFIDTAEMYGDGASETLIGKALVGRRDQVTLASKVAAQNLRPADLRAACEASLRRLRTDTIDVYTIHWPNWDVPLSDTYGALSDLQQEGKIRVIACSNFGPRDLTDLLAVGRVEADQLPYNLLWRGIEHQILPLCIERGVSVTCYSPLLHGLLTGKFRSVDDLPPNRIRTRHMSPQRIGVRHTEPGAEEETFAAVDQIRAVAEGAGIPMAQLAIAWLLHQEGVTSVIAGARNPQQVRANAAAASVELSDDILAELDRITQPLKDHFGTNVDMWDTESRIR